MAAGNAKKSVYVTARVTNDMECDITPAALMDYAMEFIGREGYWEDFVAFILRSELGTEIDTSDLRDTDIVIP